MYSREERMKAIELYIKYDKCTADVVRELGYPSPNALPKWYKAYLKEQETGVLWERYTRTSKYSYKQKRTAVEHYLEHGRNLSRTIRALGYPSKDTLRLWCDEFAPGTRKKRVGGIQYSREHKKDAVIALCSRNGSARDVADEFGVTREALYKWKNELLCKEGCITLSKSEYTKLHDDKDLLLSEIKALERQIKKLKLEKAILEGTVEIIKKDPGADPKSLTNKEKARLIGALRNDYPLNELLACLGMARSSYFYHLKTASRPDKYNELSYLIRALFEENSGRYGYRRIHALLVRKAIRVSEKIVRRIMRETGLIVVCKKGRKYSSYQGESYPAAPNLIERNFYADAPNIKWLTDITEFKIPAGKIYFSPIVDCFDGLLLSWSMSTKPNAELVNSMLDGATAMLKPNEQPIIHSDRGGHYRWPEWIARTKKAGLIRSMSSKGSPPDNAACEGVFGRIKNEMFYRRTWSGVSIDKFMDILNEYLYWYNEERIKMSLGAMSPLEYRKSLGLAM